MWFKNIALYRLTEDFGLSSDEFEEKLQQMPFRPCSAQQEMSFGWTQPLGRHAEQLVHSANGFMIFCAKIEEKVLPAAVINELVAEKIMEAEDEQGRKLSKKERTAIKDEICFELLPKAFSFSRRIYAYIDPKNRWLIVDSASTKKAEDVLSQLRKCLGSLPAVPPLTQQKPTAVMTEWLTANDLPGDIVIEDECELRSPKEEGGTIRCKRHDLTLPEIKNHLETGKQVIKLAVSWEDRLSFVVDENLSIKRLRYLDLIQDQLSETDAQTDAEHFDASFSIMSLELARFIPRLMELFGGELQNGQQAN
ncbi:MAG: recombination-associated protein RdgC [Methylicorpusculum sp.]|uniref:recombination-associated protein RdgC n=1 Tax=Methylicorpusculum sp. TaxID=2713644 RepID=UPI00271C1851|nr:recombination-associated protein RdgC [Methylicorpusculum sp.]MDO8940237.1 recombination-associated protein RdgC [Methylicorpusculum sp.]MDP2203957.1 recombination-associated protein RdgC [Methylicorpusculum sp.]